MLCLQNWHCGCCENKTGFVCDGFHCTSMGKSHRLANRIHLHFPCQQWPSIGLGWRTVAIAHSVNSTNLNASHFSSHVKGMVELVWHSRCSPAHFSSCHGFQSSGACHCLVAVMLPCILGMDKEHKQELTEHCTNRLLHCGTICLLCTLRRQQQDQRKTGRVNKTQVTAPPRVWSKASAPHPLRV